MAYAEMTSVEAGLRFKTRAGLVVETTGVTLHIESTEVNVHEVVIVDGEGQGPASTSRQRMSSSTKWSSWMAPVWGTNTCTTWTTQKRPKSGR